MRVYACAHMRVCVHVSTKNRIFLNQICYYIFYGNKVYTSIQ